MPYILEGIVRFEQFYTMDEATKLILAMYQVEGIINLIEGNPYRQYMFMHLNPVKYELERQLKLLDNKRSLD